MKSEQKMQSTQWGQAGTSPLHVNGRDHVMGRSQFTQQSVGRDQYRVHQ